MCNRWFHILIRILYTQNATWQGTIEWIEGEKTKTFGSALELVSLINETLEKNMSTNCGSKIRSGNSKIMTIIFVIRGEIAV